jgi:cAMP-specific phosphodiesterase 4
VKPAIENASEADRQMVITLLLKCADLSNVVRPQKVADAWGKRIMEEFYRQGEKAGHMYR